MVKHVNFKGGFCSIVGFLCYLVINKRTFITKTVDTVFVSTFLVSTVFVSTVFVSTVFVSTVFVIYALGLPRHSLQFYCVTFIFVNFSR